MLQIWALILSPWHYLVKNTDYYIISYLIVQVILVLPVYLGSDIPLGAVSKLVLPV
jgi:hypothetical protein